MTFTPVEERLTPVKVRVGDPTPEFGDAGMKWIGTTRNAHPNIDNGQSGARVRLARFTDK